MHVHRLVTYQSCHSSWRMVCLIFKFQHMLYIVPYIRCRHDSKKREIVSACGTLISTIWVLALRVRWAEACVLTNVIRPLFQMAPPRQLASYALPELIAFLVRFIFHAFQVGAILYVVAFVFFLVCALAHARSGICACVNSDARDQLNYTACKTNLITHWRARELCNFYKNVNSQNFNGTKLPVCARRRLRLDLFRTQQSYMAF